MMFKDFDVLDWGLVDYSKAFLMQEDLVKKRQKNEIKDTFIFCRHPSVVTLGRSSKPEDLVGWEGALVETNRGGRATYHGEGQIVVYPIVKIKDNRNTSLPNQDVRAFLEFIENWIVKTLKNFNLHAEAKSLTALEPGQLNRGVWVEDHKVASIGIAVKRWVTMHGLALNIKKDLQAFRGIKACGFSAERYTSLEELGVLSDYNSLKKAMVHELQSS